MHIGSMMTTQTNTFAYPQLMNWPSAAVDLKITLIVYCCYGKQNGVQDETRLHHVHLQA
jgi:hypothetical protein